MDRWSSREGKNGPLFEETNFDAAAAGAECPCKLAG